MNTCEGRQYSINGVPELINGVLVYPHSQKVHGLAKTGPAGPTAPPLIYSATVAINVSLSPPPPPPPPNLQVYTISMGWIILNVFLAHIYALILLHVTDLPVFVEYLWPIVFLVHNYGILLGQWSSVPLLHSPGRWCNSTGVFRPQSPLAGRHPMMIRIPHPNSPKSISWSPSVQRPWWWWNPTYFHGNSDIIPTQHMAHSTN